MAKNERKKKRKTTPVKTTKKSRAKSGKKTTTNRKQPASKRKVVGSRAKVSKPKSGKQSGKGVKRIQKGKKKGVKNIRQKLPKKPLKVTVNEKKDYVKLEFTTTSFAEKVKQVLTFDASVLTPFTRRHPKKLFFKLKIKPPREYKDRYKGGFKWESIPSPRNFKFTKENIVAYLPNLISAYNNEQIDYIEELNYDEAFKIWDLVAIFIEFIY